MSTMTLEQVRDALRVYNIDADEYRGEYFAKSMADAIDALLRERESAETGVTDEMCEAYKQAHELSRIQYTKEHPGYGMQAAIDAGIRGGLEAVAPMLASARVPDGWQLVPVEPSNEMLYAARGTGAGAGWLTAFRAMLAAAPKPEKE